MGLDHEMSASPPAINGLEDITPAWLTQALALKFPGTVVESVCIGTVIPGTATKVRLMLTYNAAGHAHRLPPTMWLKGGLEAHSHSEHLRAVYAGETLFYRELADKYETRTPKCYYADSDDAGISVVILEDVLTLGAKFTQLRKPATPDFVARALEHMARRQAASWMAPELYANEWLRSGGSHHASDLPGWIWAPSNWEKYSNEPRFKLMPQAFRDRALMEKSARNLHEVFFFGEPWALAQGDAHYGQAYEMPDGEVRFLDWSAVQIAHWCHDVSYFMGGALAPADRRATEEDLLKGYLAKLKDFGVEKPPTMEQALKDYSTGILHGVGWVMCPTEMQPEENCHAMTERFVSAAVDRGSLELALAIRR